MTSSGFLSLRGLARNNTGQQPVWRPTGTTLHMLLKTCSGNIRKRDDAGT